MAAEERRMEDEIRRARQMQRLRMLAMRQLATEFPERFKEIYESAKLSLKPPNYSVYRPWTTDEIRLMREMGDQGARAVADALGRSIATVKWKASAERITLRRPGESRGHLLGQARKATWKGTPLEPLRQEVASGEADIERIDRRKKAEGICPRCGIRPQETEDGWCLPCDVKELTRAYEAEKALVAAERENDAARQVRHRAKVREA